MKTTFIGCLFGGMLSMVLIPAWAESTVGQALDDTAVTAKVKAALIAEPQTKARQINVETDNGMVQLNGFVDSAAEKAAAASVAQQVDGVKIVENNLQVRTSQQAAETMMDDAALSTKVYSALHQDPNLKASQITVRSSQGMVALGGFAATQSDKDAAEVIAKGVSGVISVTNDISVDKR